MTTKDHSPQDLVTDYLDNMKYRYTSATLRSHKSVLSRYVNFLETSEIDPVEVEPVDMGRFIDSLLKESGLAKGTLRKYASVLKSFYKYLEMDTAHGNLTTPISELDGYIRSHIKRVPGDRNSRPGWEKLYSDEFAKFYQAAKSDSLRHEFTIFLLGHTGLLANEAASFTPEWFDRDQSIISVPPEQDGWQPKSRFRIRDIPLQRYAKKRLEFHLENLPTEAFQVTPRTIRHRVRTVGTPFGPPAVNPSLLRRTFGNRLMQIDIPTDVAHRIMGLRPQNHSSGRFETLKTRTDSIDLNDFPPLYPELADSNDEPSGNGELG